MSRINAKTTAYLLPYSELADALLAMLSDKRAGKASAPPRLVVDLPAGASMLLMPAADDRLAITKLVTVHPANAGSDLPVVQADLLVCEAGTGRRLVMLDGSTVTARRTAALSLLAARLLAPDTKGPLLLVGAGVQGRAHMEAFVEGLGVREVFVASRTLSHAEKLARYAADQLGVKAVPVSSPGEVLDSVSLIVTATTSATPVIAAGVPDRAFVAAVGAFTPDTSELPADLVGRSQLHVDTLEGCRNSAGDFIQAGVNWGEVVPLEDVPPGYTPDSGPVVFKSVGHGLWDLAAARLAVERMGLRA